MRLNLAVAGFLVAAVLFAVTAAIQLLRNNTVNAALIVLAILFLIVVIAVNVRSRKGDAPPLP